MTRLRFTIRKDIAGEDFEVEVCAQIPDDARADVARFQRDVREALSQMAQERFGTKVRDCGCGGGS